MSLKEALEKDARELAKLIDIQIDKRITELTVECPGCQILKNQVDNLLGERKAQSLLMLKKDEYYERLEESAKTQNRIIDQQSSKIEEQRSALTTKQEYIHALLDEAGVFIGQIKELKEENEHLHRSDKRAAKTIASLSNRVKRIETENKELRSQVIEANKFFDIFVKREIAVAELPESGSVQLVCAKCMGRGVVKKGSFGGRKVCPSCNGGPGI